MIGLRESITQLDILRNDLDFIGALSSIRWVFEENNTRVVAILLFRGTDIS